MEPQSSIQFWTSEGYLISCPRSSNIMSDLNSVVYQYYEKTNRIPEFVFMDYRLYRETCIQHAACSRYTNATPTNIYVPNFLSVWLNIGKFEVKPVPELYCSVFVGSKQEMENNNIDKIFEDVVLKDCERI